MRRSLSPTSFWSASVSQCNANKLTLPLSLTRPAPVVFLQMVDAETDRQYKKKIVRAESEVTLLPEIIRPDRHVGETVFKAMLAAPRGWTLFGTNLAWPQWKCSHSRLPGSWCCLPCVSVYYQFCWVTLQRRLCFYGCLFIVRCSCLLEF